MPIKAVVVNKQKLFIVMQKTDLHLHVRKYLQIIH